MPVCLSARLTLQHTATHCNTLQHTATHCNTLQHTCTYPNLDLFVFNHSFMLIHWHAHEHNHLQCFICTHHVHYLHSSCDEKVHTKEAFICAHLLALLNWHHLQSFTGMPSLALIHLHLFISFFHFHLFICAHSFAFIHLHSFICTCSFALIHSHAFLGIVYTPSFAFLHSHSFICIYLFAFFHLYLFIRAHSFAHLPWHHVHSFIRIPSFALIIRAHHSLFVHICTHSFALIHLHSFICTCSFALFHFHSHSSFALIIMILHLLSFALLCTPSFTSCASSTLLHLHSFIRTHNVHHFECE